MKHKYIQEKFKTYFIQKYANTDKQCALLDDDCDIDIDMSPDDARKLIKNHDHCVNTIIKLAEILESIDSERFGKLWYRGESWNGIKL